MLRKISAERIKKENNCILLLSKKGLKNDIKNGGKRKDNSY
jgi:hypothetical protein